MDKATDALYERMVAEQQKYRDWLKSQPPDEILNHAYEYAVREDILAAMEEIDLPLRQAAALLAAPAPLAEVYRYFDKLDIPVLDTMEMCIRTRGEDLAQQVEQTLDFASPSEP